MSGRGGKRGGARKKPPAGVPSLASAPGTGSAPTPKQAKVAAWCAPIIANADGAAVLTGLRGLGPVNGFTDILLAGNAPAPASALAAEQIIHMIDGWRYASSAVSAYLAHAEGATTHFAYYAELRAAMSLFAWSGIRINYTKGHYYLNRHGNPVAVTPTPTHDAVWGLWKDWVQRPDAKNLFADKLKLMSAVPLSSVLSSLQFTPANKTFQAWGLDLLNLSNDHLARNTASYEPRWVSQPLTRMAGDDIELVRSLWALFLSDGSGLAFDASLARYFVDDAIPTMIKVPRSEKWQRDTLAKEISKKCGVPATEIARRLESPDDNFRPFSEACASATEARNVLCRAFFLLRMAMLALKTNLDLTPNNPAKKWLEHWLTHAGIWSGSGGVQLIDIEDDYRIAWMDMDPDASPLPEALRSPNLLQSAALLSRPDACIAWGVVA